MRSSSSFISLGKCENELGKLPARLEAAKTRKTETLEQLANAKTEVQKPFAYEEELKEKTDRLNLLNIELNDWYGLWGSVLLAGGKEHLACVRFFCVGLAA